jgi:CTP synthase (UTP-ammonia lyase)
MSSPVRIALVGDHDVAVTAHRAIPVALDLAAAAHDVEIAYEWFGTARLASRAPALLTDADGVWCVPASPYESMQGALDAIRFARESPAPFLGTCGGYQHALIEFARNVLGRADADHAESAPNAPFPLIAPLACALVEASGRVHISPSSRARLLYGCPDAEEMYRCSFGLDTQFVALFANTPLRFTATDDDGAPRMLEVSGHPFYLATMFQPERSALQGRTHPLIAGFVVAAAERADQRAQRASTGAARVAP